MQTDNHGLSPTDPAAAARLGALRPSLVIYFGSRSALAQGWPYAQLRHACPDALLLGCTTGGQIHDHGGVDDEVIATAIRFANTSVRIATQEIGEAADSRACGRGIGGQLWADDLAGVFVLSDGLNVNGSELVGGIIDIVGGHVPLTGGLAGDGSLFQETLVGANAPPRAHCLAAVGFYGSSIRIGHGSAGGWDVFGPWRRVTRSKGNVVFELDTEPALDLYERYLGEEAAGLPGTGLLFPLQVQDPAKPNHKIVRTILSVDRTRRSLTFAGDVPEGWDAQLMRGSFDRLCEGAADAARQAIGLQNPSPPPNGLAILVSCIGRRLLMGQRVVEEVEEAKLVLGPGLRPVGFYSYGEISPHADSGICELHNQTMTITTITEMAA